RGELALLALEAGDAPRFAQGDVVVARERRDAFREERREGTVRRALLDLDHLRLRQVAAHGVLAAHQLSRQPVEHLQLLDIRGCEARDARSLSLLALLVDEGAAIGKVAGRFLDLLQPGQALRRLRVRGSGERAQKEGGPRDHYLLVSPGCSATVRT